MQKLIPFLSLILLMGLAACNSTNEPKKVAAKDENPNHEVTVMDIQQTSSYSYFLVKEKYDEFWIATDKAEDIAMGDVIYYLDPMLMKNFTSKELDRVFEEIYFVNKISKQPIDPQKEWFDQAHNSKTATGSPMEIDLEPLAGERTIMQIYKDKEQLAGQLVKVKGVVVKFNERIMNTNWVHVQDGSGDVHDKNFDMTLTTNDYVNLGDTVVFEGTLAVDKDFGAGYFYKVIIENSALIKDI